VAESHPNVRADVKNLGVGLGAPTEYGSETRRYRPDSNEMIENAIA
jgi:hypothetical protein